jgi:hypothetical protein
MALGSLSHSYVFGAVLQHDTFVGGFSKIEFSMSEEEKFRYARLQRLVAMIPESASVAASENEVPHIAARAFAYTLKDGPRDADYILVHSHHIRTGQGRQAMSAMVSGEPYQLIGSGDDLYLFKKGPTDKATRAAYNQLGVTYTPKP